MRQTAKRVMFSESCTEVSVLLRHAVGRWNIKIKIKLRPYTLLRLRPPEAHLPLNEWNIPFVNHVKHLGVLFDDYMGTAHRNDLSHHGLRNA
jgi:hypothetical protein